MLNSFLRHLHRRKLADGPVITALGQQATVRKTAGRKETVRQALHWARVHRVAKVAGNKVGIVPKCRTPGFETPVFERTQLSGLAGNAAGQ